MTTATQAPTFEATTTVSDTKLIAGFFFEGMTARQKADQIKGLTPMDKAQLGCGIRNGTLDYD